MRLKVYLSHNCRRLKKWAQTQGIMRPSRSSLNASTFILNSVMQFEIRLVGKGRPDFRG